jgi:hypothetical protein
MDSRENGQRALTFALYQGDQLVQRVVIHQDVIKVGKDPKSHLRLDDELASRMHAVIEANSIADITLIDLGNEPGTLLNGQRVNKSKLRPGDWIQIGSTAILLENAEPAMSGTAAAARGGEASANPFVGPNPFVRGGAAAEAPYDGFVYSMTKSGPDVSSEEVEDARLAAIEVMILWGSNVLHVAHLAPTRAFYVGEELGDKMGCDYFIPSEMLGTTRAPVVVSRDVGTSLVILPRSRGYVDFPGQGRLSLADLVSSGRARRSAEVSGGFECELPAGTNARMQLEGSALVFQVAVVDAGKKVPVGLASTMEPGALLYSGLSFLVHMGLLAAFAFFMPGMRGDDTEGLDRDRILLMQRLLNAAAEREQDERQDQQVTEVAPSQKEGGTGTRARGEEGSMGNPNTKDTGRRYGVQGPKDNPDPHLAKQAALQEAAQFGMIGLISTMGGGNPNAPTAAWGREDSSGRDDKDARGNMFGDDIGDAAGAGGLGLTGLGEGGGGKAVGIGLGNFGDLGHGSGIGDDQGIGSGRGILHKGHQVKSPRILEGVTSVNGRLPPEVIQRIVRQNFGRFRLCYQNALRSNPNLQGRVTVKFAIDRSGAVQMTADGGSDLPDQSVVQCVVRAFANLSFPEPEGGVVTVVYPIVFNPGD